jgi:hypothetical protein
MHGNADFLNRLKKDAAKRNRKTESIAWIVGAVVAGALAIYATKGKKGRTINARLSVFSSIYYQ